MSRRFRRVAARITLQVDASMSRTRSLIENELGTLVEGEAQVARLYCFETRLLLADHEDGNAFADRVVHCLENAGHRVDAAAVTIHDELTFRGSAAG